MLQYPLTYLAIHTFDGNFTAINIGQVLHGTAPSIPICVMPSCAVKRSVKTKRQGKGKDMVLPLPPLPYPVEPLLPPRLALPSHYWALQLCLARQPRRCAEQLALLPAVDP